MHPVCPACSGVGQRVAPTWPNPSGTSLAPSDHFRFLQAVLPSGLHGHSRFLTGIPLFSLSPSDPSTWLSERSFWKYLLLSCCLLQPKTAFEPMRPSLSLAPRGFVCQLHLCLPAPALALILPFQDILCILHTAACSTFDHLPRELSPTCPVLTALFLGRACGKPAGRSEVLCLRCT